ncbi:helix-turn-helix transcriptional regulator [Sphingomonas nostoxanthinifaciens]|uniref:helix-turn-helix transcriptional regulator n=1 Tax=Sphingomonas nostoxanthinifaciens TaxID=2872652 RepID=UPI001CC1F8D1|nr:helix-turn-helix transcriptional regulator [Sphingomonas nostoxanthinifaciens]UAK23234.1 hypothetical protein K8P63_12530 [Sphingomonas nostoxanthinifaciens]
MAAAVHDIVSGRHRCASLRERAESEEGLIRAILCEIATAAHSAGALLAHLDRLSSSPVLIGAVGLEQRAIDQILPCGFAMPDPQPPDGCRRVVLDGCGEMLLFDLSDHGAGPLLIALSRASWPAAARIAALSIVSARRGVIVGIARLWWAHRHRIDRFTALQHAVDAWEAGLLLVDDFGTIIHANQSAEVLLATGNGLCRINGSVRATNLSDAVSLQAALAHASLGADGDVRSPSLAPMLTVRRQGLPSLVATVLPISGLGPGAAAAAIYLIDPRVDAQRLLPPLCALYRLTPVETRLVGHLVQGATLMAAAKAMRIKLLTARGYLKQIFVKTDTGRQPELIALMLSSLFRVAPRVQGVGLPTHDDRSIFYWGETR